MSVYHHIALTTYFTNSHLFFSYTYLSNMEMHFAASFGCLWQNQAIVTHFKGTCKWQLPNSKTEPLANHVILLADQCACQDVRFTCRHCDRFAKHASLPGNGVTTHRDGMKAARWLTGTMSVSLGPYRSGSSAVI